MQKKILFIIYTASEKFMDKTCFCFNNCYKNLMALKYKVRKKVFCQKTTKETFITFAIKYVNYKNRHLSWQKLIKFFFCFVDGKYF